MAAILRRPWIDLGIETILAESAVTTLTPRPLRFRVTLAAALPVFAACAAGVAAPLTADPPIDYAAHAFFPERWKNLGIDTWLVPWAGDRVVLLTRTADLDPATVRIFLERLDGAWKLYAETVGRLPQPRGMLDGKPTVAAVPDGRLTCGVGCGTIGAAGVEICGFYDRDYALVRKDPRAFPHYYFYEIGRNYYVFGDRHSSFITGFAVFMRYVCMDALGCTDPEAALRTSIESAEARYAEGTMGFLRAFTMQGGLGEKAPRLEQFAGPSDQPVLYASAMLKLRRDHGGDVWAGRFFRAIMQCPEAPADTPAGAITQSRAWLVAASVAARRDLSGVFCDRWRLPVSAALRMALAEIDWTAEGLDAGKILARLPTDSAE